MSQDVEVGPIWNQRHAKEVARKYERVYPGWEWTGAWRTVVEGQMSVINVRPKTSHDVLVWNQEDSGEYEVEVEEEIIEEIVEEYYEEEEEERPRNKKTNVRYLRIVKSITNSC